MVDSRCGNRQRQLTEEVTLVCRYVEALDESDLDLVPMLSVLYLEASLAHSPYVVEEVVPCRAHWRDEVVIASMVDLGQVTYGRQMVVRDET